jgi:ABC-type thiamine transport system ATPase subunit
MNKLTSSTNMSKYVNLPMIAVMGNTSSGKSSLLSSISMVEFPSSSELTTHCPIVLQMRCSEEQVATVGIFWHDRCVILAVVPANVDLLSQLPDHG